MKFDLVKFIKSIPWPVYLISSFVLCLTHINEGFVVAGIFCAVLSGMLFIDQNRKINDDLWLESYYDMISKKEIYEQAAIELENALRYEAFRDRLN